MWPSSCGNPSLQELRQTIPNWLGTLVMPDTQKKARERQGAAETSWGPGSEVQKGVRREVDREVRQPCRPSGRKQEEEAQRPRGKCGLCLSSLRAWCRDTWLSASRGAGEKTVRWGCPAHSPVPPGPQSRLSPSTSGWKTQTMRCPTCSC